MGWKSSLRAALEGEHPQFGRSILFLIYGLIVFSVLSISIESSPTLPVWGSTIFTIVEVLIVTVFTVEYILRIVIAEKKLAYICSFWGLVDLVAILPFYLNVGLDLRSVRVLRLLRISRLLKLARYTDAIERLKNAFRIVREELAVFGLAALLTLYICALGIHFFARGQKEIARRSPRPERGFPHGALLASPRCNLPPFASFGVSCFEY